MNLFTIVIPLAVFIFIFTEYRGQKKNFPRFFKKLMNDYGLSLLCITILYVGYIYQYSSYHLIEGFFENAAIKVTGLDELLGETCKYDGYYSYGQAILKRGPTSEVDRVIVPGGSMKNSGQETLRYYVKSNLDGSYGGDESPHIIYNGRKPGGDYMCPDCTDYPEPYPQKFKWIIFDKKPETDDHGWVFEPTEIKALRSKLYSRDEELESTDGPGPQGGISWCSGPDSTVCHNVIIENLNNWNGCGEVGQINCDDPCSPVIQKHKNEAPSRFNCELSELGDITESYCPHHGEGKLVPDNCVGECKNYFTTWWDECNEKIDNSLTTELKEQLQGFYTLCQGRQH